MVETDAEHDLPIHDISSLTNHTHRDVHHFRGHSGTTILFIFLSCLLGVVFMLGCAVGVLSTLVEGFSAYTLMADMDPHLMLHIFLPVLVFDSAYALETHTLLKSFPQVVILSVPAFMFNAFLTGILVLLLFPYEWSWPVCMAFGTIISATDPVAVVATLKELGTDKKLAILLEGESLLNDGAALVFFTVFLQMARGEYENNDNTAAIISLFFLKVLFGGMALGYIMGKFCSAWLARIFNDAVVETIITIAFPYITYFIAEAVFEVSGVLAVVVLGVILSSEKTSISPQVEKFLHSQWNLLAFASNTLIFVLVGIVISEQGLKEFSDNTLYSAQDWFYIFVLYLGIFVIRAISLLIFSPVLKKLGYGFDWCKGIVMWWGALRGAVSLALALLVAEDDFLDPHLVGSKFLLYAAGIVVLTLVVNGCTMRPLLNVLGLTKISISKKMAMTAAVKALEETQKSTISNLRSDRFLADAHWDVVMLMSEIKNPYADRETDKKSANTSTLEPISYQSQNNVVCPDCNSLIKADLTPAQYKEYEEESRVRYLKAQKISYWRQFETGMLGRAPVRKLMELAETAADKAGTFISITDIQASWKMRGIYRLFPLMSKFLSKLCAVLISQTIPTNLSDRMIFKLAVSKEFSYLVISVLLAQLTVGSVDLLLLHRGFDHHVFFLALSIDFSLFFLIEFIVKIIGFGPKLYIFKFWNAVSVICLIVSYPEIYAAYEAERLIRSGAVVEAKGYHLMSAAIRVSRSIRLLETLIEAGLPFILNIVERRVESQLNFGYDVGRGFVVGEEECRQLLDHIVEHPGMRERFKNNCDKNRLAVIKELALLQRSNPGVAVAVKTRQATRTVLNKVVDTLHKLLEDGLIDESEGEKVSRVIGKLIKLLVSSPPSVPPMPASQMLSFVPWLQGVDSSIAKFMKQRAQLINFDHDDIILKAGEAPKGIYIVVSGLVKIYGRQRLHSHYSTQHEHMGSESWTTPSAERYTDYLGAGAVLAEMGPLMNSQIASNVTAETAVQLYFLNMVDLEMAFDMYPEVKLKLWKNCAVKIVLNLLAEHKDFQMIPKEAAKLYLDKGYIPYLNEETTYNIDDNIGYAFVVHGRVRAMNRPDLELVGPTYIPSSIRVLEFNDPQETILYLIPAEENPLTIIDSFHEGIRHKLKAFASQMGRKVLGEEEGKKKNSRKRLTLFDIANKLILENMLKKQSTVKPAPLPKMKVSESSSTAELGDVTSRPNYHTLRPLSAPIPNNKRSNIGNAYRSELLHQSVPTPTDERLQPDLGLTYKTAKLLIKSSSSEAIPSFPISSKDAHHPPLSPQDSAPPDSAPLLVPISGGPSAVREPAAHQSTLDLNAKLNQSGEEQRSSAGPRTNSQLKLAHPKHLMTHRSEGASLRSGRSEPLRSTASEPSLHQTYNQVTQCPPHL